MSDKKTQSNPSQDKQKQTEKNNEQKPQRKPAPITGFSMDEAPKNLDKKVGN